MKTQRPQGPKPSHHALPLHQHDVAACPWPCVYSGWAVREGAKKGMNATRQRWMGQEQQGFQRLLRMPTHPPTHPKSTHTKHSPTTATSIPTHAMHPPSPRS